MVTATTTGPNGTSGQRGQGGLARVRFYPRQLLEADDLRQEQAYHRERARRHNRHLHGWGVGAGCQVQPAPTDERPWQVRVCPGYLLTPPGDEVLIPLPMLFDIADCTLSAGDPCAFARPCPPISRRALVARRLHLAVRYVECEGHPVRLPGDRCGCGDGAAGCGGGVQCEFSRIQDGYELCCLSELPATHTAAAPDCQGLCQGTVLPFDATTDPDPWVVLATITLPDDAGKALTVEAIDELADRWLLYPTSAVQRLARCTCAP
jgi:hypothetical protein